MAELFKHSARISGGRVESTHLKVFHLKYQLENARTYFSSLDLINDKSYFKSQQCCLMKVYS